jgi:F-type H+-transporting ATPase subunit b
MHMDFILAAAEGGVVDGLKHTAAEVGEKFGFNTQLFISQFIGFFVVAFLLHRFAYKPLLAVLDQRERKIADSLAAAEKMKADLAKADEDRKKVLAEAGAQAQKIIEEARAAAAKVTETETQKAVVAAKDIIEKARQANEAELARMKSELRKEIGRLVVQTSSRVTGKILTLDDQQRLADETNRQVAA